MADDFFSNSGVRNLLAGVMGSFLHAISEKDTSIRNGLVTIFSGGVTAFCGATEIGQGSDDVLATCVAEILGRSGIEPDSHDGKALQHILDTYPRDELFQIGEEELLATALGMEDLAFMAWESAKQAGITVQGIFDDYLKRIDSVVVAEEEPANPTNAEPSAGH